MAVTPTSGRSAELSLEALTLIPADATIRPLRDHLIIEPLPIERSGLVEVVERIKPLRGRVKAVGPGHYPKRYDHPDKHRRSKMWDSESFQPTQVQVGDIVELGGYNYGGYSFPQIRWGETTHLICREADVAGIVE